MKRTLLLTAAVLLLVLLFCGCEGNRDGASHTNPPRVTANVTSSPAPSSPTPSAKPTSVPTNTPTNTPDMGGAVTPETGTPAPSDAPKMRNGALTGGIM